MIVLFDQLVSGFNFREQFSQLHIISMSVMEDEQ